MPWRSARKRREFASKSVVYALKEVQGDDPRVAFHAGDNMFNYENGSRIFVAGMGDDNQRQALRSINGDGSADIIWGEEANALIEDDHNELLARRRGKAAPWRQIIYSTNPDVPNALDQAQADGRRRSDGVLQQRQRQHAQSLMTTLTRLIACRACYTCMAGAGSVGTGRRCCVRGLERSNSTLSTHPDPVILAAFSWWTSGYTNPFVCQWWALDQDGRMYRYREIYMSKRTVKSARLPDQRT